MAPRTDINALCDQLIEDILLHLPCSACLAAAAAVCKLWERTIHAPTFRRRYSCTQHDLALFIFGRRGNPSCRLYIAADGHRHSSVSLGSFLPPPAGQRESTILHDVCGGRLLISSINARHSRARFTVCDPKTGRAALLPPTPFDIRATEPGFIHTNETSVPGFIHAKLVVDAAADGCFLFSHVVCLFYYPGGIFLHLAGSDRWVQLHCYRYPLSGLQPRVCVMMWPTNWGKRYVYDVGDTGYFRREGSLHDEDTREVWMMESEDGEAVLLRMTPDNLILHCWCYGGSGSGSSHRWWGVPQQVRLREVEGWDEPSRSASVEIILASRGIVYLSVQNGGISRLFSVRLKTKQVIMVALLPEMVRRYDIAFPILMPWPRRR